MKFYIYFVVLIFVSGCVPSLTSNVVYSNCGVDSDCEDIPGVYSCNAKGFCEKCTYPVCKELSDNCIYIPDYSNVCPKDCGRVDCIEPDPDAILETASVYI